jgi:hypothetical protein
MLAQEPWAQVQRPDVVQVVEVDLEGALGAEPRGAFMQNKIGSGPINLGTTSAWEIRKQSCHIGKNCAKSNTHPGTQLV